MASGLCAELRNVAWGLGLRAYARSGLGAAGFCRRAYGRMGVRGLMAYGLWRNDLWRMLA